MLAHVPSSKIAIEEAQKRVKVLKVLPVVWQGNLLVAQRVGGLCKTVYHHCNCIAGLVERLMVIMVVSMGYRSNPLFCDRKCFLRGKLNWNGLQITHNDRCR